MKEVILNVEGMECGGCEKRIQNTLKSVKGIKKVVANHIDGTVKITAKEEVSIKDIKEKIDNIGFCVKDDK